MKEKDLKSIWQVPKYLPYLQPPLTEEILASAEQQIGHKLPEKYIELLKNQNGGYIRFTIRGTPHRGIDGIGPYFPSITDDDFADYEDAERFKLNGLIPFDGDGHWFICFDYRKDNAFPAITYIDTEMDEDNIIAPTFEAYLDLLELDTERGYVIDTNLPIEEIVKKISGIVNINFEGPDYYAQGYPIYSAKFKHARLWVSPNKVPSGFIREDDDRYEELKSEMGTMSLRYPEIPDQSLLITVSDEEERTEIFQILANNSFRIKSFQEFL